MSRPHDPALLFAQIAPERQAEALALCWPELAEAERLRQYELAGAGGLESTLWGASRAGRLVGAIRVHVQAGRAATLAPPQLAAGEPLETAIELIRRARDFCREAGCQVSHALLPDSRGHDAHLLSLGGLRHVADLVLLVSLSGQFPGERPPLTVELHDLNQIGERRIGAIVSRTYEGSQDFPQIEGVRAIDDVLAGYRAAGLFAAERWLTASRGGEDVGCLILTAVQDTTEWELTYLGVVPAARGAGLGVQLVRHAQWMTRCAGKSRLVVAVDAKNAPALAVYEACGFVEWNRQSVFWCAL